MKISELIEQLSNYQNIHGDIEVKISAECGYTWTGENIDEFTIENTPDGNEVLYILSYDI